MANAGRTRKFFYGDMVTMTSKDRYPRHVEHRGIVVGTRIIRPAVIGHTKVNYNVQCGCGALLAPKGDHMELISGPVGDEMVSLIHETRFEHFLALVEATINNKPLEKQVAKILAPLTEREQYILTKRFGLDGQDSKVLREIGEDLGITKARVQQLEQSLLERLRK